MEQADEQQPAVNEEIVEHHEQHVEEGKDGWNQAIQREHNLEGEAAHQRDPGREENKQDRVRADNVEGQQEADDVGYQSDYSQQSFDEADLEEAIPVKIHWSAVEEANAHGASRSIIKKNCANQI